MAKKKKSPRKLPKNAKPGTTKTITVNPGGNLGKRKVTFQRTKKKANEFGAWKIKKNQPA